MIAQGDKGNSELPRQCRPAFSNLRAAIRHTAPHFIPRVAPKPPLYALGAGPDMGVPKFRFNLPLGSALQATTSNRFGKAKPFGYPAKPSPTRRAPLFQATDPCVEQPPFDPEEHPDYSEDSDDGGDHESRSKPQLVALYHLHAACKIITLSEHKCENPCIWTTSEK